MPKTYSTKEVCELTGIPKHCINQWTYLGLYKPQYGEKGRGKSFKHSELDILKLKVVRILQQELGIPVKKSFPLLTNLNVQYVIKHNFVCVQTEHCNLFTHI